MCAVKSSTTVVGVGDVQQGDIVMLSIADVEQHVSVKVLCRVLILRCIASLILQSCMICILCWGESMGQLQ